MVYISIGTACNVKYQIDRCKGKSETLFFDWLMTSMSSVIEILSCDDITKILYVDNCIRDPDEPFHSNNSRILVKSLDFCVSIHDLKREFNDNDLNEFIDKYKRRFNRILEFIKSEEPIYFMRYGSIDAKTKQQFIDTILKINSKCNFHLVVIDNDTEKAPSTSKDKHYLSINLNMVKPPSSTDWTTTYLDWPNIFMNIEKNLNRRLR